MESQTERRRLLKADEVAKELGVRPAFVYELARRRLLPVIRVGRYCRFDPVALARWLERGGVTDAALEGSTDLPPVRDLRRRL